MNLTDALFSLVKKPSSLTEMLFYQKLRGDGETYGSADIVSFETKRAKKLKSLSISLSPIQDLHGYDNPWPAGGGKNLFDKSTVVEGLLERNDGSISTNGDYYVSDYIPVKEGEKITFTGFNYWYQRYYDASKTLIDTLPVNSRTVTIPSGVYYLRCSLLRTNIDMAQVEYGSTATAYAPYSNICPITGHTSATVTRTGKNLLDNTLTSRTVNDTTFTVNADKSITVSGTPTALTRVPIHTGLVWDGRSESIFSFGTMPTGTRIYAHRIYNGTQNYPTISPTNAPPIGAEIYDVYLEVQTGFNGTAFTVYPQLELGSTATDYEAYDGDTYTIQLGQTVYGGTVDVVTGVLTVDRAVYDFTANDVWTKYEIGGKVTFNSGKRFPVGIDTSKPCIMSNYPFIKKAYIAEQPDKSFSLFSSPWLSICDSGYSDATTFAQAMAGNRLVYYLATPITYQLTPQQVLSLAGQNVVWSPDGEVTVKI